ncbi:heart- and neural crest derivatives-expressed protein 2 [Aplysia californica]|uniref:Heart- and neural crest derivatives-expressed protein 2 n=1 Tax=Aplysia californica TaxID=6500 RepID=A0ABM0ZXT1_APLCA|nr:heart- and neural crest derivatives-expressed protein 2 [Aplysia californica]
MSLSVGGYPQSYPHHPHPHQPHHYHHPHHHTLQTGGSGGGAGANQGGGAMTTPHDFYPAYPHPQMSRYPEHPDSATAAAAAAVAASGGYFPNWMLSPPPELTAVSGHIPDGYHSFGAPGSNSPGGTHYQSFIQYENGVPVRCIKRRVTANKKERRRTLSINNAFAQLRGCIPNVPSDTKLSKIKTLRLATSYISYLMDILAKDDPELSRTGFKAELTKKVSSSSHSSVAAANSGGGGGVVNTLVAGVSGSNVNGKPEATMAAAIVQARTILDRSDDKRKRESDGESETSSQGSSPCPDKKPKGRTGWPQHVWASELKT